MNMTIDQQVALDEALVPHASRLRIRKSNFRLKSDISSKEPLFNCLEYLREMMHICPRLHGQTIDELSFEEEILAFLRFLGHSGEIRRLTDNVDLAYLLWEDFVYQVEHKDAKKSNEMYYPRFTKVIIHYFMTKDLPNPKRNKVNWHYVRDDQMFTTIKLVSRHQNTQQFGAILPIKLTNEDIRHSEAYKEYHAVATGVAPPKTKASVRKTKSSFDTTVTPPTAAAGTRLSTFAKGKQPAKASKAKSLTVLFEVAMTEAEHLKLAMKRSLPQTHISQASDSGADEGTEDDDDVDEGSDDQDNDDDDQDDDNQDDDDHDEGDDDDDQDESNDDDRDSDEEGEEFIHPKLSIHDEEGTKDEESFDTIAKTPKNSDDEGNDDENLGLNVGREEGQDEEDDEDELYRDVNINLEGRVVQMADVHITQEFEDTHVTLTLVNLDGIDSIFKITSQMDVQALTTVASLTLSAPTLTPSTIATISTVPQTPTPLTTAPSTLLQDLPNFGSLFGFDHRLKTLEANFFKFMQTNQFAGVVSFISGIVQRYMDQWMNEAVKIEKMVNEQLEAEVLTRSSNSSKTSYAVIADLSKMKLKKILIEKMEGNKSIHRLDEQRNLYKAQVKAYESVKIILDTYGDTVTLKRRRDDDTDKDEEPSTGSDRGSKRRREGKEPESTSAPKEKTTRTTGKSTQGSKSQQRTASESVLAEEPQQKKPPTPNRDWNKTLLATHGSIQPWISELAKQADSRSSFNELMDTPVDFSAFLMNRLKVDTLTLELLAGPTYELMKGSCKSLVELEFFLEEVYKATTYQLDWNNPKGQESARDVYSKCRIIAVTELQIVEWHNYKHLDYITMRRDDDKLYKFKEGDFKRLRIQDIEDMLLLLNVHEKHRNPKARGRPSTRCRKLPKEAQPHKAGYNKDKQNRLMRIDELHKFSNGTLNDVRTALDDRLKGIRMKYLPYTI
nr:hypothetical protein [Tanacetum cinerariifolium]